MKLPKHIVLSGGGAYGVTICIALKHIEEKVKSGIPLLESLDLSSITGVSVGSIIGVALLCNYTMNQFKEDIIMKFGVEMPNTINMDFDNLITNFGMCKNAHIHKTVSYMINKKYGNAKLTFMELYEKTNVKFQVGVTNVNNVTFELWSHETQPNMPLAFAISTSSCVPFIFSPVKYRNNMYIDGGLMYNFPPQPFKENPDETLGIGLYNTNHILSKSPENIEEYGSQILYILRSHAYDNQFMNEKNTINGLEFHNEFMSFLDEDLNAQFERVFQNTRIDISKLHFFQ